MPIRAFEATSMNREYLNKLFHFIKSEVQITLETSISNCIKCKKRIEYGEYICDDCYAELKATEAINCSICGRLSKQMVCQLCRETEKSFISIHSCYEYRDFVKSRIIEYKEHGKMYLRRFFADSIVREYKSTHLPQIDLITSVPSHWIRRTLRMCDVPQQMAKAVSKEYNIEYKQCIKRISNKHAPRKSNRATRLLIASNNFISRDIDLSGKTVLLIDDVVTTGSTCQVCANQLMQLGASSVYILSLCCVVSR